MQERAGARGSAVGPGGARERGSMADFNLDRFWSQFDPNFEGLGCQNVAKLAPSRSKNQYS